MSVIVWSVLGLIPGVVASRMMDRQGETITFDVALGILGAIVGGLLFSLLGAAGVTGFSLSSVFVALAGSVVVLVAYHALLQRQAPA